MNLDQVKGVLPRQVLDIADAIGLPATQRLVEKLGGTTWLVAKGVRRLGIIRHQALVDVIGIEAADIMAKRWANVQLYIPRCDAALRAVRDFDINAQYVEGVRNGVSANALVACLALKHNLSDRRIWEILKTPTDLQSDLFH